MRTEDEIMPSFMAVRRGMQDNKRPHLPDCASVRDYRYECNCGRPRHPLPYNKALVRRFEPNFGRNRLRIIPKSKVCDGERDLNETDWMVRA